MSHQDMLPIGAERLHHESVVAAALHAEGRSTERTRAKRLTARTKVIERVAHVRRRQQPRTGVVVAIESDGRLGRAPFHLERATSHAKASVGDRGPTPRHDEH